MKDVKGYASDLRPPMKEEQIQIALSFARIGKENDIGAHNTCGHLCK